MLVSSSVSIHDMDALDVLFIGKYMVTAQQSVSYCFFWGENRSFIKNEINLLILECCMLVHSVAPDFF